ncbi:hypothetical protein M407DRAFT_30817 [Tulasnella calospora MUT 4182]|uniref:C2H2-type domain-containing protein n=1 Tax=Tulasnella calospora MUT 4182 TaxID=1051891 RepID=A0A0C3Q6Q5_9AGAM|nr:hypothetical protein M407DRAFT_30817 [Tulasnella calospora MUT 4182]
MSYYPSKSTKKSTSPSLPAPMNPQQQALFESDAQAYWSNTFGDPSSRPSYYGLANQPSIQWEQVPSSAGVPVPPPQQPNPSNQIPGRVRSRTSQPGQGVFQAVVSPSSIASSSSQPLQPPVQGKFSLNSPPMSACRCKIVFENQSRKNRHWESSCPYNQSLKTYQCEVCGAEIGRKDNLNRHMKTHYPA